MKTDKLLSLYEQTCINIGRSDALATTEVDRARKGVVDSVTSGLTQIKWDLRSELDTRYKGVKK